MSYRIVHCDERGVRLRRTNETQIISALGLLFSLLFVIIGGSMVLWGQGDARYTGAAFLCGAALFSFGPAFIVGQRQKMDPAEIIFDNEAALIAVVQGDRTDRLRGFIPYQDVDSFIVRREVRRTSGSNSSMQTRSVTVFVVGCLLKSGGTWELFTLSSEEKASLLCALLTQGVKLDRTCAALPQTHLPAHLHTSALGDRLSITWKNTISGGLVAFVVLFFSTFFALLFLFNKVDHGHGGGPFGSAHTKVMLGGGLLVLVLIVVNLWRSFGQSHRLYIDRDKLEVTRLDRGGNVVSTESLPRADVLAIRGDVTETAGAVPLSVYTASAEQVAQQLRASGPSVWAAIQAVKAAKQTLGIDFGILTTAERVTVENYLNQALRSIPPAQASAREHAGQPGAEPQSRPRPETGGPRAPISFWWEHAAAAGAPPRDILSDVMRNGNLGLWLVLGSPLPLLILLAVLFPLKQYNVMGPVLKLATGVQILLCALGCLGAYRLLRARRAWLRALLFIVAAVVVVFERSSGRMLSLWADFGVLLLGMLVGLALLGLPEEDERD